MCYGLGKIVGVVMLSPSNECRCFKVFSFCPVARDSPVQTKLASPFVERLQVSSYN